jgi:hypothetical protein
MTQEENKIAFPVADAYYKLNADNKLELHLPGKTAYSELPETIKNEIKRGFIWGRQRGAWVSRSKGGHIPYSMYKYNIEYKGADEVNSFEDMQERKATRAENKAERFERYADNADKRAESLKSDFNRLRKDWSWLTQPITPGAGGRAFANHKNKVMARYDNGMRESIKADNLREYAENLKVNASQSELNDVYYLQNRIKENTKIVKNWPKFEAEYAEIVNNPDLATSTKIWIDGRLQAYKLAFDKLEYFNYHLDKIHAENQEKGIISDSDQVAFVKKHLPGYLTDKYKLKLLSFTRAFVAKGNPYYLLRVDGDLPDELHSGFASRSLAQLQIKKLYNLLTAYFEETQPKLENDLKGINRVIREKVERKQQLESQLNTLERSTAFDLFSQPAPAPAPTPEKVKKAEAAKKEVQKNLETDKAKKMFSKSEREVLKKRIEKSIDDLLTVKHPKHDELLTLAQNINAMRSLRSQIIDGSAIHKNVIPITPENVIKWARKPGQYDLPGVDAPGAATVTSGLRSLKKYAEKTKVMNLFKIEK